MTRFGVILRAAAALAAGACGGSADTGLSGPGTGGSAGAGGADGGAAGTPAGGGGGAAGSPSTGGGGGGYTLDDVCEKTAPIGCGLDQPCCMASGFGYDQAGCVARAIAGCKKDVAEVQAGTMQFDATTIDACIAALKPFLQECVIKGDQVFPLFDALEACTKIWTGTLPEGASCDRDAQCAPSGDPSVYVSCDDKSKTCRHLRKLEVSDTCELSDNAPGACGPGLFCDASFGGPPPYTGICKSATPVGQVCNQFKPYDLECGFGFYCNQSTGVCTTAKVGGTSCLETVECQTLTCTLGQCTAQEPLVDQATCTG
jgi:hypothetical protein